MTKALPFTVLSIARAIRGVEAAGRFVIGVRADGTLIVGDKPINSASMIPQQDHNDAPSKWGNVKA